ncbi:hypothetical protein ACFSZS_00870 [Seohaeicola zhoushanensis]
MSCFRGPWKEVIWDRANPVFIDSLIKVGYDYPSAHAIGERICRDASLVDNPEGMKAEMIRVFNESPKYHNPRLRAQLLSAAMRAVIGPHPAALRSLRPKFAPLSAFLPASACTCGLYLARFRQ